MKTQGFFINLIILKKKNNNACAEQYIVPKSLPRHNALPDEKSVCWMLF